MRIFRYVKRVVLELDDTDFAGSAKLHYFDTDNYRESISIDAFTSHKKNRWRNGDLIYIFKTVEQYENERKIYVEAALACQCDPPAEWPKLYHESLWDFYKAIGYNPKTKKYESP